MFEKRVLEVKERVLADGRALYSWVGTVPRQGTLYQLNMLFLYVVYPRDGAVFVRKVACSTGMIDSHKKIVISTILLRAVDQSTGRKRVCLPDELMQDERAYPAGLMKNVECGPKPYMLNPSREGDVNLIGVLSGMSEDPDKIDTDKMVFPTFYTCGKRKEEFRPKMVGGLTNILKRNKNYVQMDSVADNFNRCFEECFDCMADGRYLVDSRWVMVKGFVVADLESVHRVYAYRGDVKSLDCEDDTIHFSISKSVR